MQAQLHECLMFIFSDIRKENPILYRIRSCSSARILKLEFIVKQNQQAIKKPIEKPTVSGSYHSETKISMVQIPK